MDVYVNSDALSGANQGLVSPLNSISEYLTCLDICVNSAKDSFQTVNSEAVNECFLLLQNGISNMQANVTNAQKFLEELQNCIEKYDSLRF